MGALPLADRVSWRAVAFALLTALLTLPAMWPLLSQGGYWESHDGAFHLYRLLSLRDAWAQGIWYPRLFPDFAFGYGYAVLNFYGPPTYYVALALSAVAPPVLAMKLAFTLSYPLSALAMWWAARDLWRGERPNEVAGLLAAAAYTYVPYHLADVQLRGALAESWAFVWWPLVVWGLWRGRMWVLALSMAALIVTHNLSAIMTLIPLSLLAALALLQSPERRALFGRLLRATLYALLISSFYWVPVLIETPYVKLANDVGGTGFMGHLAPWREWIAGSATYYYTPNHGVEGRHPLSWAQIVLLLVPLAALPALWRRRLAGLAVLCWLVIVLLIFLLTPTSIPIWEVFVVPFGMIQYPGRWLGLVAVATALLVGTLAVPREPRLWRLGLLGVTVGLLAWLAFSSLQHLPWEAREIDPARHPVQMWEEDAAANQVGATWTAEFLPQDVTEQRWLLTRSPQTPPPAEAATPLQVQAAGSNGAALWARVSTEEVGWLTFPRFTYPSMRLTVNGQERETEPRSPLGLASVRLEPGEHEVVFQAMPLSDSPWLTWLLGALPMVTLLWGLRRHRRAALSGLALAIGTGLWLFITDPPLPPAASLPQQGVVTIGEQAQLLGLRSAPAEARPGETVPLTLLWFNLARTNESHITFVHLQRPGDAGPPLAQHDSIPNSGTVPTTRWLPGALVEDLHLLTLPDDLPGGTYELWSGMYRIIDGASAPLPNDSGDRHLIGTIIVGE
mgnify:CR=1 FL=1